MTGSNKLAETILLAPGFPISRIIKGGWQLSEGHSNPAATEDPIESMFNFAERGITTLDCADIYTGVEELIGRFLVERKKRLGRYDDIKVLTKFVPDYDALATINKQYVERIIDRSLTRLGQDQLDMVQFSWWNYGVPRYVETAYWLKELQQAGKINLLSGTNFNTHATAEIVEAGIKLSTLQVQYSLLDRRPEERLVSLCARHGIKLLCYGTVAGGFLSDAWLGKPEPFAPFENRSLVKYKLMIHEFGGWSLFQELLTVLQQVATKAGVSISNVATRFILDKAQVGAAIIGARTSAHLDENLQVFKLNLTEADKREIAAVLAKAGRPAGDVFDVERIKEGPHGSIMRYNLNG
jgi:aryl-alcohol dehydrogenase-like predicted oxidoreductase